MIDVIITSDIKIYCEGLGQILTNTRQFKVLAVASDPDSALAAVAELHPDIVLLDMTMAGSCQLAEQISALGGEPKIVALAVSYDERKIMCCAEVGITCYVPREASVNELIDAVRESARDGYFCPPGIAACLLRKVQDLAKSATGRRRKTDLVESPGDVHADTGSEVRLTRREQQIAQLLVQGMANKQIARHLCIEVSTVKNHVHNLLVKLKVGSRGQAVVCLQQRFARSIPESLDLDPLAKSPS